MTMSKRQGNLDSFFGVPKEKRVSQSKQSTLDRYAVKPLAEEKENQQQEEQEEPVKGVIGVIISNSNNDEKTKKKRRIILDDDDDEEEEEDATSTTNKTVLQERTDQKKEEKDEVVPVDTSNNNDAVDQALKSTKRSAKKTKTTTTTSTTSTTDDKEETKLTAFQRRVLENKRLRDQQCDHKDMKQQENESADVKTANNNNNNNNTTTTQSSTTFVQPSWDTDQPLPYKVVCDTLEQIEAITGRLEIQGLLTQLYRQVIHTNHGQDLYPLLYLTSNTVAPAYQCVELGIGDAILIKAIGEAYGTNPGVCVCVCVCVFEFCVRVYCILTTFTLFIFIPTHSHGQTKVRSPRRFGNRRQGHQGQTTNSGFWIGTQTTIGLTSSTSIPRNCTHQWITGAKVQGGQDQKTPSASARSGSQVYCQRIAGKIENWIGTIYRLDCLGACTGLDANAHYQGEQK
jgi:hypothetical protein